jgi:dihydroorotase
MQRKIFFLGTDNAPRPAIAKEVVLMGKPRQLQGVFTQPYATQLVLGAVEEGINQGVLKEEKVTKEILVGFLGVNGRRFYKEPATYSPARRECHAFSYIIRWQH